MSRRVEAREELIVTLDKLYKELETEKQVLDQRVAASDRNLILVMLRVHCSALMSLTTAVTSVAKLMRV